MKLLPLLLLSLCSFSTRVLADDDIIKACRGDEITVDLSDPNKSNARPRIYELDPTLDALPKHLSLNRRTGVVNGIVRDSGFRNVYTIGVIGTDPVNQQSIVSSKKIQVDWCQGTRISRFWLVDTDTNLPVRVLKDGDTVSLSCLGGFSVEVETYAEIATEAQSEGDLTDKVVFKLDGMRVRTESVWPFALGGDVDGDYKAFPISLGEHRLEAIPYNANRDTGLSKEIIFTVVNGAESEFDA